ncbi:MAG: 23S rRNA (adenine(2503)-C(2))-methyltransferase RlmN [Phycisphaerae bacterium]
MTHPPGDIEHLLEFTPARLRDYLEQARHKPFRARQLLDWVWKKNVIEPAAMSNVPNALAESLAIVTSRVVAETRSKDGTVKLLVEYPDGARVETVLIPSAKRATVCLSTQVGCAMECAFCATGIDGLVRNLSAGEILEQIIQLRTATGAGVTNVVFMGMGEPLANFDATLAAVEAIVDPQRLGLSARHVTVSTIGLPEGILRLAEAKLPITLAISLHAPTDELRRRIIPRAGKVPLERILSAAKVFYESRRREVTLEYILIPGLNDSGPCAAALADIAGRLRCNVNLIRYNPVASLPWTRPSAAEVEGFAAALARRGVNVTVRASRGLDADAACGQLRRRRSEE